MTNSSSIDLSVIESLKELMGDAFEILITTFIDDTGKLVHSLSELQKQNDIEVFTRNAHSVKSSSANLGAMKLSTIAAELEAQGKTGDIASTIDKIILLENEFTQVCSKIKL